MTPQQYEYKRLARMAALAAQYEEVEVDRSAEIREGKRRKQIEKAKNELPSDPIKPPPLYSILQLVAAHCDIPPLSMFSRRRTAPIAKSRALACAVLRDLSNMSYPEIARACGYPGGHSSTISACRVARERYAADLEELKQLLRRPRPEPYELKTLTARNQP